MKRTKPITGNTEEELAHESRVAVLGTLAELHQETIHYDLKALQRLVKDLRPDLLCAEIHPDDWRAGDFNHLAPEYQEILVPLAKRTDIIIVPVSGSKEKELFIPMQGHLLSLRTQLAGFLTWQLHVMQRMAGRPEAVNSGAFAMACDWLCRLITWVCGAKTRQDWNRSTQAILDNVVNAIRRDPGRRVLVTVDCRRRHLLEQSLRRIPGLKIVDYRRL